MIHGTHNAIEDNRNKEVLIYVNGEFYPRNEAKISVFDSGYLVGDGIWEGIRMHRGKLVFIEDHMDRLFRASKATGIALGKTPEEFIELLQEVCRVNNMDDGIHLRLMITRGIKKNTITRSTPNYFRTKHCSYSRT